MKTLLLLTVTILVVACSSVMAAPPPPILHTPWSTNADGTPITSHSPITNLAPITVNSAVGPHGEGINVPGLYVTGFLELPFLADGGVQIVGGFLTNGAGGTTINPSDTYLPYRSNATTFADSLLLQPSTNEWDSKFGSRTITRAEGGNGISTFERFRIGNAATDPLIGLSVVGQLVYTPITITYDGVNVILAEYETRISGSGGTPQTITNTPAINAAYSINGSMANFIGGSDAATVTFQDQSVLPGSGFLLKAPTRTLGSNDVLTLVYLSGLTNWVELGWSPRIGNGGTKINPTDTFIPYRSNATTFADTPLYVIATNKLGFNSGTSTDQFLITDGVSLGIGTTALANATTMSFSTAFGYEALNGTGGQTRNTAFGAQALQQAANAPFNTAVGVIALADDTTGSNNTSVGDSSGQGNTTGFLNSFFGFNARPLGSGDDHETVIGAYALGAGPNSVTLGDTNVTTLVVGTATGLSSTNTWTATGTNWTLVTQMGLITSITHSP